MKIQCDVCHKSEAVVYCAADEASLCNACDHRVHHANKLASKHPRFSLLNPSFKDSPRCDICQERRAFLFCKEDRAILCRECDIPIHMANEHTQKHTRFLLTGVKLSTSISCYDNSFQQTPCSSNSNCSIEIDSTKGFGTLNDQRGASISTNSNCSMSHDHEEGGSMEGRSISEYLMETLPGRWHVDEFLDPYGFATPILGCSWSQEMSLCVNSSLRRYLPKELVNKVKRSSIQIREDQNTSLFFCFNLHPSREQH